MGYIAEFFGYQADDASDEAVACAALKKCPFLNGPCAKILSRSGEFSGVCALRQNSPSAPNVICCPIRIYADDYKMLREISQLAFKRDLNLYSGRLAVAKAKLEGGAVAVFGHRWGGELRLPKRNGVGSYFVDWVLARLDERGELAEFTAIEVQTIDTTGNYRNARLALLERRELVSCTASLNWENVSKRILPQLIYKGQVLQREDFCKTGLFFVCPGEVWNRVIQRLGGEDRLPSFPTQPASVHFIAYDYLTAPQKGKITPLGIVRKHSTTVYKLQEAFSTLNLPEGNVYRDAICKSLYGAE